MGPAEALAPTAPPSSPKMPSGGETVRAARSRRLQEKDRDGEMERGVQEGLVRTEFPLPSTPYFVLVFPLPLLAGLDLVWEEGRGRLQL